MTIKYKGFMDYLDKSNVISSGVGFAVGLAVNNFFNSLINTFVIQVIEQSGGRELEELTLTIGGSTKIRYGGVLMSAISLGLVLFASYIIIKSSNRFLGWS